MGAFSHRNNSGGQFPPFSFASGTLFTKIQQITGKYGNIISELSENIEKKNKIWFNNSM